MKNWKHTQKSTQQEEEKQQYQVQHVHTWQRKKHNAQTRLFTSFEILLNNISSINTVGRFTIQHPYKQHREPRVATTTTTTAYKHQTTDANLHLPTWKKSKEQQAIHRHITTTGRTRTPAVTTYTHVRKAETYITTKRSMAKAITCTHGK